MRKIDELKLKLKGMAEDIKKSNVVLKEAQRGDYGSSNLMFNLYIKRLDFRYHHIAYCELRGRTREQIEKPREHNEANELTILNIKNAFAWEIPTEAIQEIA